MGYTTRAEGAETVVRCHCGWEEIYCNRDLCDPQCPPDCERREEAALVMAAENHECGQRCPGCQHAPHAGRCFFVATPKGRYIQCDCKVKREIPARVSVCCGAPPFGEVEDTCDHCREHATFEEEPDDGDSVLDAAQPGRGVAGVPAVHDLAQRHLTACRTELTEIAEDIQAQTRAIGRTMTEGAARMRGESNE